MAATERTMLTIERNRLALASHTQGHNVDMDFHTSCIDIRSV